MSFGQNILKYREDIIKDISKLVEIKSYSDSTQNSEDESKKALNWILNRAEEMGLATVNIDDIVGHVEYGTGDNYAAVLTHVDVVPPGEGWDTDPFVLTEKSGKIYGRGVADDKGAAVIALYCMKALKDNNIDGVRQLRAIFGAMEETGQDDMKKYFSNNPLPKMAFTPDSEYGICNREKGILHIELSQESHDGKTLTNFHAGSAINAVPDKAWVLLDCTENDDHRLQRLADAKQGNYDFRYTIDGMMIVSTGKAAHAANPELGFNAATHLIRLLAANFGHKTLGSLCAFLDATVGLETHGALMGIKMKDEQSGELTLNVGKIDINSESAKAYLDIRYPVTRNGQAIFEIIRKRAEKEGIKATVVGHQKPLFIKENMPLISILKDSYKTITGEEANLYYTGGGTYARSLNNRGVAFGPVFEGEEPRLHDSNENMDIEKLMLHAQICLEAMYRMITTKD